MKYKLNENELKIIDRVVDITSTDYEIRNREMPIDSFVCMLEDLLDEIEHKDEVIDELERPKEPPEYEYGDMF